MTTIAFATTTIRNLTDFYPCLFGLFVLFRTFSSIGTFLGRVPAKQIKKKGN